MLKVLERQANPRLTPGGYTVQSIKEKEFLFGNLFSVEILLQGQSYKGLIYHDHSTEQATLLRWGIKARSDCQTQTVNNPMICERCNHGFIKISGKCLSNCGAICEHAGDRKSVV